MRVSLARSLITKPALILIDEPEGIGEDVVEAIREAMGELPGSTWIISTKNPHTSELTQQVAIFKDGRLIEQGPRRKLMSDIRSVFHSWLNS